MNVELAKLMGIQIGKRLNDLNMSQKDLARIVGTTPEQICFICGGKRIPKVDDIPLYASALKCNIDYLYGNETVSSLDDEIRAIGNYTGLNDYSIKTLHKHKIEDTVFLKNNPIDIINLLIEQDSLGALESIEDIKYKDQTIKECSEIYKRLLTQNNEYNKNHVTTLFQHISEYLNLDIEDIRILAVTSKGYFFEQNSILTDNYDKKINGDIVACIEAKYTIETLMLNKIIDDFKRLKKIREEEHYNVKKTNK